MPVGTRVRGNNAQGTTTDNPLAIGATTINSAGLANLPVVTAGNHAVIILDPLRAAGAPEIVLVTAHTAAATSATITRGAYGTTARAHNSGTLWVHAPTIDDVVQILTSGTRPSDPYRGQLIFETDTNSFVARDTSDAWQTAVPLGAWTAYTPTLTQSVTVTKTVTYAKYQRVGRMINVQALLACTGAGTAGNAVVFGLPVAAANATSLTPCGTFYLRDDSAGTSYHGAAVFAGVTTSVNGVANAQTNYLGVASFAAALANLDVVGVALTYEAAS